MMNGKNEQNKLQMKHKIEVVRIGIAYKTLEVEAESREEAEEKALAEAGDHEYNERYSDYKVAARKEELGL